VITWFQAFAAFKCYLYCYSEGGATHPELAAKVPPRPQPPPVMMLYVPVASP
jgi:hypothetical protein